MTDGNMGNNNNKLGLAWQICTQGLEDSLLCNGGEWGKKLCDIRAYLKLFDGLRNPIKAVTFISYTEHGAFVVSLAPHTENPGNYKAVWIYVPNTVEISGDELERACNKTKDFLLSRRPINELKSDGLFLKTYPEKVGIDYSPSTKENEFGVFYMNDRCHLEEILGNYLYQENFSKYDAVFLLEENEGISIKGNSSRITDLSKEHLEKYYILHCPDTLNLYGQPKIYFHGQPFVKDVRVKKGDTLSLTLKRSGFYDEKVPIEVKDEGSIEPVKIKELLNKIPWKKEIRLDSFRFIIGEDGESIKDKLSICVKVNGKEVGNDCIIEEDACKAAKIEVYSSSYELAETKEIYNLLDPPVTIKLKRKIKTLKGKIELANGKEADITLVSKHFEDDYINKEKSPLKGYSYDIQRGTLFPDKWTSYAIGALAMVAIEIIALCCYQIGTSIIDYWDDHCVVWNLPPTIVAEKHVETVPKYESSEEVLQKPEEKDLTQVLNYLDRNDVWSKEELDRYTETVELFDALNRFDDKEVERIYKEKLSEQSTKLRQIVDAFSNNRGKDFHKGKEANNGLYNKENDYKINVENYINWLSDYHAPTTSQQPMTKTGQTNENTGLSEAKKYTDKSANTSDHRDVAGQ